MSATELWLPAGVRDEAVRRDVGAGMVRYLEQKGISPADMVKAVRQGTDGQTITDLSQLARSTPGVVDAMGAPFATTSDPGDPMFSAAAMGPGAPARPFPLGGEPRQFQYRVGFNFPVPPDADRGISSQLLRLLADQYDLLRTCIELAKNEIASLEWDIVPREQNRKKRERILQTESDAIAEIRDLFAWPEAYEVQTRTGKWERVGRTDWQAWVRAQLEEFFVGDWMTTWPRYNVAGSLVAFERVDGSTIRPLLDSEGRQPPPPYPAWQQYLYGVPRKSFALAGGPDTPHLYYSPRNPRNNTVYGFSHVEQMLMVINLALRWQMWVTQAYTDGALPLGYVTFPEMYTKDLIKDVITELNASMGGLAGARQEWHGLPAGSEWHDIKPFQFDETFAQWLIEYTAANFGYSAQKLGFMPGRGGHSLGGSGFAQQQSENSDSSEKIPNAKWVMARMNELLAREIGRPDLEFIFVDLEQQDEKDQIDADSAAVFAGFKSWDQALADRGEDAVGVSEPFIVVQGQVYSVADIKLIQDGGQRNPAPGVPLTEEEAEAANAPKPPPMLPPGFAGQHPAADGGSPAGPADARALPTGAAPKPGPPTTPGKEQQTDAKPVASEKPDAGKTFDTGSGMQPHDLGGARAQELRRWKRKAVRDKREGRVEKTFTSDVLNPRTVRAVTAELAKTVSPIDVRLVFDRRITKAAAADTTVAGLVVLADDTGRILLIQRSNSDPDDPARGTWEFPGGHLEPGETPIEGAMREWKEETGISLPPGEIRGQWKDGIYEAFIYAIPHETDLPLNPDPDNRQVMNPDDPDGDDIETAAWWDPADLPDMPALRDEVGEGTPWDDIAAATPDTVTKAVAHPMGQAGLDWAHYRAADQQGQACETCVFYKVAVCTMFAATVQQSWTCDYWEGPAGPLAKTEIVKAPTPEGHARRTRTSQHEQHIQQTAAAVLKAKAARARGHAGHALREAIPLTEQDHSTVKKALLLGMGASYLAGANQATSQMGGSAVLDKVPLAAQTFVNTRAQAAATQLSTDWDTELAKLLSDPDATPDTVADGLERFADWKSEQLAVTQASRAYNEGKLFSFQAYPQQTMYDWNTAGDDKVCDDCDDRASGGPYTKDEIDLDGSHDSCRCEIDPSEGQDVAGNDTTDDDDEDE